MKRLEHLNAIGMSGRYRLQRAPCEVCGGSRFKPLQSVGRVGEPGVYGPLPVWACGRCGFVMINPRYERRFYANYYRSVYRRIATGSSAPTPEYLRRQIHRGERILRFLESLEPVKGRMLDIGCSAGATMIPFQKKGWRCVGLDPDVGSVKAGRSHLGLPVRVGHAENLPFRRAEFDLALSLGTFEHVRDLPRALRQCRRVLKPGGLLLMRIRSQALWGSPLEYYNHNHYRYFSEKTLRLALLRHGFEPLRFTDQLIEGIPGAAYVAARAGRAVPLPDLLRRMRAGDGDDAEEMARRLRRYRRRYRSRARSFLSLVDSCSGDSDRVLRAIRDGRARFTILDGPPREAVARAELEARLFLQHAGGLN